MKKSTNKSKSTIFENKNIQINLLRVVSAVALCQAVKSQTISCPTLNCDSTVTNSACYLHDETQPVEKIYSYSCDTYQLLDSGGGPQQICDFSLNSSAWFNEDY